MSLNSTITSDESVPGKQLLVHLAENGHSFEIECDVSTPVKVVQRYIESVYGVQVADQLLLCGKVSLDPQQPLGFYKLPQDAREIFVYNRARLLADSPRPPPEVINVPKPVLPSPRSQSDKEHPCDKAADPALRALASYEKQFRHHYDCASAHYQCAKAKLELCGRLLREQQVQERALETARGNLEHVFRRVHLRYKDFFRCFMQQRKVHSELLMNFERDVERLRALRLHPAVQTEGRRCLLDLVKVNDLRRWHEICSNSHRQFESKVLQLRKSFEELAPKVEGVLASMTSAGSNDVEVSIQDHQKLFKDHEIIMQSLSKDVSTVKKLVDECLNCQLSASLRPHDAVSALGPMYDAHKKNHLPNVQNCDNLMTKLLEKCKGKKDSMNLFVHVSMQKVKEVQFSIKDLSNQLHAFEEVMGHQEKEFENLKFVNGVGHAYRACLAEVIRRKSSLKLYMGLAGQLAERLATEREAEIRRREGFYKAWSKYIPNDILAAMGLFDTPSQCDVNMAPFDTHLLDIDVADVDRYAPQAVVGLLLKSDTNKTSKSNLGTSRESCNSNRSADNTLDAHENCDTDGVLEVSDSVDIAGTSKLEVENARLKAELASAIALICTFNAGMEYDPFDQGGPDEMLKVMKEKTAEALHSKDEYVKHLQSMLNEKQVRCSSYEKRIQELEQRSENQYVQGHKLSSKDASESGLSEFKVDGYREGMFEDCETHMPSISTVSMDEGSSTSALDPKLDLVTGQTAKPREAGDENMTEQLGIVNMQAPSCVRTSMDASMQETPRVEQVGDSDNQQVDNESKSLIEDAETEVKMMTAENRPNSATSLALDMLASGLVAEVSLEKTRDSHVVDLQNALADKSDQLMETENQLKAAMEESSSLRRELEATQNLLDESQLNCAHLENCLHEAREESRTNKIAAERRASEYSALRTTAVRMHSLFERFRSCVTAQVGMAHFADSLHSLALSLASSASEDEDDGTALFRSSIKILSEKVGVLSQHRSELLERCSSVEAALEEKVELIKNLYSKLQLEKQVSREKISFARLELHELACFILNPAGHYEAIHRGSSNYYLSVESVALFTEQRSGRPQYIIGRIVHIGRHVVRFLSSPRAETDTQMDIASSEDYDIQNPYGLPAGCEYFIVTVAMLPSTVRSSSPS